MKPFSKKPLIIAHRGASALAPENTFAAFQRAIDVGAEGIEFDVQLSKDGIPVVVHDFELKRLALMEGLISDLTSAELQKLNVGSWFNEKFPNLADENFAKQTVPTLENLLDYLKEYKGLLYLELKCRKYEIVPLVEAVGKIIERSELFPQIILKSFRLKAIAFAKIISPDVYTASLFSPKIKNVINKKKHLLEKAEDSLANEISLHYSLATKKLVKKATNRGLPVTIWTADNPRWVKRGFDLGINAIITNDPERLLKKRREILRNGKI
jgi:glycerophosphoryl diester phosphodiesterase